MAIGVLATVDAQCRLLVSNTRHKVVWLEGSRECKCVVDVIRRGQVRVWPVDRWAANEGLTSEDAERAIHEDSADPLDPGSKGSGVFLVPVTKKEQGGRPIHELRLPDTAIFALFDQGVGQMVVRKGRREGDSGKLLLRTFDDFFELWGQSVL